MRAILVTAMLVAVMALPANSAMGRNHGLASAFSSSRSLKGFAFAPFLDPLTGQVFLVPTNGDDGGDGGEGGEGGEGESAPIFVQLFEAFTEILGDVAEVAGNVLTNTVFDEDEGGESEEPAESAEGSEGEK